MEKPVIMFDSPEAATYREDIKGWVSRNGLFYGDNSSSERGARWSGCTHQTCECGVVHEKSHSICSACLSKQRDEKYNAFPVAEWDGITPVCTFDDDHYFFDESSLIDWMGELKWEAAQAGEGLPLVQLVLCTPHKLRYVDADFWADDLAGDGDLPDEVQEKLNELNEAIKRAPVVSWEAGTTRINVDSLWEQVEKEEVIT